MKASELIKILMNLPDLEVQYVTFDRTLEMYRHFSISKDYDVGHSDKIILLSGDEI
jgi:IS30 family transposase